MKVRQVIDSGLVDVVLFKQQRDTLHEVIDNNALTPEQAEHLQGLENFLDDIYDQLVPVDAEDEEGK
jgi:hypothetical protein